MFPNCSTAASGLNNCKVSGSMQYLTTLPLSAMGGFPYASSTIGVFSVLVRGVQHIAVVRPDSVWLWPTTNTGAYNNSIGSCCVNSAVGSCCWASEYLATIPSPLSRHPPPARRFLTHAAPPRPLPPPSLGRPRQLALKALVGTIPRQGFGLKFAEIHTKFMWLAWLEPKV